MHNVRSIRQDVEQFGEEIWARFKRGRDKQEWYYRNVLNSLGHSSKFPMLDELEKE